MKAITIFVGIVLNTLSISSFAEPEKSKDITGIWNQIDDKTGTPKAIIEIRKEANQTYTGKIIKINNRPGYKPKDLCNNCPKPYTNKPILGMDILTGIRLTAANTYTQGKIIDPLNGHLYSAMIRSSTTGNRLTIRAYIQGITSLGRSQTWLRAD